MNEKRTSIEHYKIFDFWKDKCIDKSGYYYKFSDKNSGSKDYVDIVYDWGEPNCWCCGAIIPVENEINYFEWLNDPSDNGLKKIWNSKTVKKHLERAHIKPRMLGGNDEPKNLFLLCSKCHKESPDTGCERVFLMYIYARRTENKLKTSHIYKAYRILKDSYGITIPYFSFNDALNPKPKEKIGLHFGSISENSYIYTLVADALKNRVALRSDLEKMFLSFLEETINEFTSVYHSHFSHNEIDEKALDTIVKIKNAYETFKKMEMNPNADIFKDY